MRKLDQFEMIGADQGGVTIQLLVGRYEQPVVVARTKGGNVGLQLGPGASSDSVTVETLSGEIILGRAAPFEDTGVKFEALELVEGATSEQVLRAINRMISGVKYTFCQPRWRRR